MTIKCMALNCTVGYSSYNGPAKTIFKCPKDSATRNAWLSSLQRQWNPAPPKDVFVCEDHFEPILIQREQQCFDIYHRPTSFVLTTPKLIPGAKPTIFTNLPFYAQTTHFHREGPDEKRMKRLKRNVEVSAATDTIHDFEQLQRELAAFFQGRFVPPAKRSPEAEVTKRLGIFFSDVISDWHFFDTGNSRIVIYTLIYMEDRLTVGRSIQVAGSMSVSVLIGTNRTTITAPLRKWSVLRDLILSTQSASVPSTKSHYETLAEQLEDCIDASTADDQCDDTEDEQLFRAQERNTATILVEQLRLMSQEPKARKYSEKIRTFALELHSVSRSAYRILQKHQILILPSDTALFNLSRDFRCEPGIDDRQIAILKERTAYLETNQRVFVCEVDEIYNDKKLELKGGTVVGAATNDGFLGELAPTTLVFYVSGVFSRIKQPVAQYPVKGLTAPELAEKMELVAATIEKSGLELLCYVTDNNAVNGKAYTILKQKYNSSIDGVKIADNKNPFCALNQYNPEARPLFLTHDFVHIFKSWRNNWLRKGTDCQFLIPYKEGEDWIHRPANFLLIRDAAQQEYDRIPRRMHKVTPSALNPKPFEKQSVRLAHKIFCSETRNGFYQIASENPSEYPYYNDLVSFLDIVITWWKINNIKHPLQGIRNRDELQHPFRSLNDPRIQVLVNLEQQIKKWEELSKGGNRGLTGQTFEALLTNIRVLLEVLEYLLETRNAAYVLPGKFTTDDLEGFFGWIRQLSGAKFNVSVNEILQATKKTLVISYLTQYKVETGPLLWRKNGKIKTLDLNVADPTVDTFRFLVQEAEITPPSSAELQVMVVIAGYAVFKLKNRIRCATCFSGFCANREMIIQSPADAFSFLKEIDRGGLTYPTDLPVAISNCVQEVLSVLTADDVRKIFLSANLQSHILSILSMEKFCAENPHLVAQRCEDCGVQLYFLVSQIIQTVSLTLLSEFVRRKSQTDGGSGGQSMVQLKKKKK